jgi:hypothetical protein
MQHRLVALIVIKSYLSYFIGIPLKIGKKVLSMCIMHLDDIEVIWVFNVRKKETCTYLSAIDDIEKITLYGLGKSEWQLQLCQVGTIKFHPG